MIDNLNSSFAIIALLTTIVTTKHIREIFTSILRKTRRPFEEVQSFHSFALLSIKLQNTMELNVLFVDHFHEND